MAGSEENVIPAYALLPSGYAVLTREGLEAFADTFDFAQIDAGGEPTVLEKVNAGPRVAADPGDAMTLSAWAETDEYRRRGVGRLLPGAQRRSLSMGLFDSEYTDVYPCRDDAMKAEVRSLCEEYGLKAHETIETVYNKEISWEGMPEDKRPKNLLPPEEFCAAAGCGPFIRNGDNMKFADIYEDGSFRFQGGPNTMGCTMTRVAKGSFASSIPPLGDDLSAYKTWNYETSGGAVVCLATGAGKLSPSLILYETDTSYVVVLFYNGNLEPYRMEAYADYFDFTQIG
jgi:hypothetical protein